MPAPLVRSHIWRTGRFAGVSLECTGYRDTWSMSQQRLWKGDAVSAIYAKGQRDDRPWGSWRILAVGPGYAVKRIVVRPGARLSLQRHAHRAEHWIIVGGEARVTRAADTWPVHAVRRSRSPSAMCTGSKTLAPPNWCSLRFSTACACGRTISSVSRTITAVAESRLRQGPCENRYPAHHDDCLKPTPGGSALVKVTMKRTQWWRKSRADAEAGSSWPGGCRPTSTG